MKFLVLIIKLTVEMNLSRWRFEFSSEVIVKSEKALRCIDDSLSTRQPMIHGYGTKQPRPFQHKPRYDKLGIVRLLKFVFEKSQFPEQWKSLER
jgi:hypothetical protein